MPVLCLPYYASMLTTGQSVARLHRAKLLSAQLHQPFLAVVLYAAPISTCQGQPFNAKRVLSRHYPTLPLRAKLCASRLC